MSAQQAKQQDPGRQDVSVLVRSVENVFRHLARLLVGRITLSRLQAVMREVFVQEAEAKLRRDRPGRNVPLSQLALLTGLDTRTLIRIRGDMATRQAGGGEKVRISELSPEAKLVETWALSPGYRDERTGEPRVLSYNSPGSEFEQLVREVITARGVTVQSTLERLLATNSVEANPEKGELTLLTDRFSPFNTEDESSLMATGLQAIFNLTGTIDHNVRRPKQERLIQRELWTFRLDQESRGQFRDAVREYLVKVEKGAEDVMEPMESEFEHEGQMTAGLGFYYFEEEPGVD